MKLLNFTSSTVQKTFVFIKNKDSLKLYLKMLNKFIFVWCLSYLYSEAYGEHFSQYFQESSDNTQCSFDVPRKIYNVTDLLR